jgi:hypothetical protein
MLNKYMLLLIREQYLPLGDDISVRGGVPGKYVDQSLRIPMKSEGMAMKARAFT